MYANFYITAAHFSYIVMLGSERSTHHTRAAIVSNRRAVSRLGFITNN